MSMHRVVISAAVSGLVFCTPCLSEDKMEYGGQPVRLLALMLVENAAFHVYEPPYQAKAIYRELDEAKCLTPESLMESIRSEINQKWVDHNMMPGTQSHSVSQEAFDRRKQFNMETNYFRLLHKMTFSYNGTPTAIIKYVFVDNGENGSIASLVAQKIDGRWYRTSILGIDRLEGAIRMFDSNKLAVLLGVESADEEESIVVELKQNSMTHAGLNTETIIEYFMRLRAERNMEALSILTGRDVSGK